jgi:hypothetical protein
MSKQEKPLERAPLLQQIQANLKDKMTHPVMADSPVVREMLVKQGERRA